MVRSFQVPEGGRRRCLGDHLHRQKPPKPPGCSSAQSLRGRPAPTRHPKALAVLLQPHVSPILVCHHCRPVSLEVTKAAIGDGCRGDVELPVAPGTDLDRPCWAGTASALPPALLLLLLAAPPPQQHRNLGFLQTPALRHSFASLRPHHSLLRGDKERPAGTPCQGQQQAEAHCNRAARCSARACPSVCDFAWPLWDQARQASRGVRESLPWRHAGPRPPAPGGNEAPS